ncbi:MAG: GAF domain-containing sensor histidine kinase [Chloroflexota bacterium]|nr:GAF domain-containing sensor histidine kinase [Chloroflexota bacterium]
MHEPKLTSLQSILETVVEFEETGDFEGTWNAIIRDAVHLMGASRGTVFLVDRAADLLVPRVWFGTPWQGEGRPRPYQFGEGIAGRVWASGELQVLHDVRNAEGFRPSHSPHQAALRSLLCVPIRAREHVIGVIAVDSTEVAAFDEEDQRLLATLARYVASAWERAKLFQGLDAMREVGARMNSLGPRGDYQTMLREIAERALEVVAAGATNRGEATAVLYRYDGKEGRFDDHSRVGIGTRKDLSVHLDTPRSDGMGARAVRRRERILSYEESDLSLHPAMVADDISSIVCYPLLAAGNVLGVLYVSLRDPRPFTRQELLLLDNFVNQAALAFYHTEQAEQAQRMLAVSETFAAVGDIAANLMHRLNNQVGTIPVRVQGIQQKSHLARQDPYVARNLIEIERAARDAMGIVRDTVRHLRPIELTPVRVEDAWHEALHEAQLPRTVLVKAEGLDDLPPVRAGAPQLELIFHNLLQNASDAMEGEGRIVIRGSYDDDTVTLLITDSGPGIPEGLLERVFELNVSGGSERKLGFGLWWVRSHLHRCGGDIAVRSRPGEPAIFEITLPRW